MADKRISQLVDRGTVANNDVVPIVVSGATTTNKATISSIQTFMQGNLDVGVTSVGITIGTSGTNINVTGSPVTSSGNITINIPTASAANRGLLNSADWNTFNSKLDSVGLIMPSAFTVTNSPLTSNGSISVAGAGTVAQYIRGDGSLADFPQGGGGGGASVSYYLNGSVSQGTIGGIAYREMNKTPILGAGTDFTINADGYIASFITDAGDPSLLQIPGGNWNFETYFQASSGGGSPSFYVELYKVNSGGTATLIASSSANPELIAFGTNTTPYFSALAVPTTTLTITDRLAIRYYVVHSGRTITLHTENGNLCQIITTFTTGLTALNGLTAQVQNFAVGTSGTDFAISSATATHTFNLPTASATNRGALSSADWTTFNGKQNALTNPITGTGATGQVAYWNGTNSQTGSNNLFWDNANVKLGIGTNTPEGTGLTVAGGGVLISLDSGAARKVLELYATSTGAKVSSSYVGASSYGSLELLTSGLARLTIADTGASTFSGSVGVGGATNTLGFLEVHKSGSSIAQFSIGQNSTYHTDFFVDATGNFYLQPQGNTALTLASTGAATFSSSVTASQLISLSASGSAALFLKDASANNKWEIGHISNSLYFYNYTRGGNDLVLNGSTGAATFSSSLSANGVMSLGNDAVYGSTYKTLGLTGNTNGTHRIFAGTADNLYIAAATARGISFWVNGTSDIGTITSDGYVRLTSASGGIQFNGDTAAANALDDYEEGTWTPTVRGGTTAGTYTLSNIIAYYTKIGNKVTIWANFGFSVASGGTTYIKIGGAPFSYKANSSLAGVFIASNLNTSASSSNGMGISSDTSSSNTTFLPLLSIDNAAVEEINISGVSTSTSFIFTISYTVS
jgi:hypothetical protein